MTSQKNGRYTNLLCVTVAVLFFAGFPVDSIAAGFTQKCGDLQLSYHPSRGASLSYCDIEFIRGSSLVVVNPDWSEVYYSLYNNPGLLDQAIFEDYKDGKRITLPIRSFNHFDEKEQYIEGHEIITLLPDNSIQFQVEVGLLTNKPARIEWKAAEVSTTSLLGCSYRAITADGDRNGRFPLKAGETVFADQIQTLTLESRLGPITIESGSETQLKLFDFRTNRWCSPEAPYFWMGRTSHSIEKEKTIRYEFIIRFPEDPESAKGNIPLKEAQVEITNIRDARIPTLGIDSEIIPKPKQINYTGKRMPLKTKPAIYLGESPSPDLVYAAQFLAEDLIKYYDIKPVLLQENCPEKIPAGSILLGSGNLQNRLDSLCEKEGLKKPEHQEGYALSVTDNYAALSATTPQGTFYGVTTLLQLIALDEEDHLCFKGAEIVDYPSLSFRGIHCFTSKDGSKELSRAFRDLMARFKINKVVWECEFLKWDHAPEIAHEERGMDKSEARKVIQTARENFIEPIPLVPSLGHSQWMFTNSQNLDLAEDPETPYAYNPTNPDTYKFIFSIFQEAIELFQPKIFHIGHDEVTLTGRFPYRSQQTGKSATDLVMEDIEKLNQWFKKQNIEVMLWGDMFLADGEAPSSTYAPNKEEARKRRDLLPRNIWVADWHYRDVKPEEFISLPLFKNLGHPVVGCSWYRPGNIANQSIAARKFGAEGMLHTTWAGYNFRIDENQPEWYQYMTYITAAHYFWSDETAHPDDLSFNFSDIFLKTWFQEKPLLENQGGFTIDLTPFANRSLVDTNQGEGWVGLGPQMDLSVLSPSQERFGDVLFNIPKTENQLQAVLFAGKLNPQGQFPKAIHIDLKKKQKADQLHFLMTAAFPAKENSRSGNIEITYMDGQKASLDLHYKRNLFAFTDDWINRDTRIVWKGRTKLGQTARLWDLVWTNPYPHKRIVSIQIRSTGTEAAPILLGITGVEN